MPETALTTRIQQWLDDEAGSSGNPFATMARSVLLGTRLNELAALFTSGAATGASMIPVLDALGLFTGLNVETCLAELRTTLVSKATANVVPTAGGVIILSQAAHTVEAAVPDDVDTLSGGLLTSWGFLITGTQPITYRDAAVGLGNIATPRDGALVTATGDVVMWVLSGSTYRLTPLMIQAGYPESFLANIPDAGSYYTQTTLALMLQELFSSALGGTDSTTRAYSGGVLQEPPDNATLTAAIASLMLLRRDAERRLVMDEATPSATAGRGLVVSGAGVTPQGVPDASVAVAGGVAYNQLGQRVLCTATDPLAVTDPNPLGGVRNDIVVIPAGGGVPVVREGTVVATDPALTAGDVPLARLRCPNGAVTISVAEIDDLQQTARTLPAAKLLPATTADLLVLLATDQITNAVLIQAILDGAFQADAPTRALFADLFLPDAKLAQDRGKTGGFWLGQTGGSTDITGGAATRDVNVDIDGAGASNIEITAAGLNTGALIASALQAAIRAVGAGGYTLAEVHYDPVTLRYYVVSGTRGNASSVAITAGTGADVADDLNLLAADGAKGWDGTDNIDGLHAQIRGLFRADEIAGSTAAPVPAAGTVALTRHAVNVLTPAGAGAYNLANMTGLANGEWAFVSIDDAANPATIQDNATGGGVIWTRRAASIVLADTHDVALVVCDQARYKVFGLVIQAGQASGADGAETVGTLIPMALYGAWGVDVDGARTNGGGLVGQIAALLAMGAAYCKVYDVGTTTWANVSASDSLAGWTNPYQLTADAANEEVGDLFAFGFDAPTPEFAVDLATPATWGGDGMKWTYSDGPGSRADLTVAGAGGEGYDNTDTTARNGKQSLQQDGAVTYEPPSDWAADTVDGQNAYWVVGEIAALQVTQTPVLNGVQHDVVAGEEGWRVPHAGNVTALVVTDAAAVLHTTQDVVFVLWDANSGEHRKFTWSQDRRRQRITCTPWALTTSARLFLYVIQEDTAAEPTVNLIEVEFNFSTTDHTHLT